MDEPRRNLAVQRRLSALAGAYVTIFRPQAFADEFLDPEYSMSPRQARDILERSFARTCADELGTVAAYRILRGTTRNFLLIRHGLRATLVGTCAALCLAHGLTTGVLLQAIVYLATRPISWMNRGRGARIAESVIRAGHGLELRPHARRRALRRTLDSIPAAAITSRRWGDDLVALLPKDEATREIALKLADQYEGDIASLVATSRALAH